MLLTIGPLVGDPPEDDVLAEVWQAHRRRLLALSRPLDRPWAWWRFEPDIPDDLRAKRRPLVEVDPNRWASSSDAEHAAEHELAERRADWLATTRPGSRTNRGSRFARSG